MPRSRPWALELECLTGIPGADVPTAENVIPEIGADIAQFPAADRLASWAGICPGTVPVGSRGCTYTLPKPDDRNCDGVVDFGDINLFVALLGGG